MLVMLGLLLSEVEVHVLLLGAILWVAVNSSVLGYSFRDIKELMNEGLSHGLSAFYIFMLIGVVIAGLIESGAVATLVYHALDFVTPGWFLPSTLLICAFMSVATGTSWGTVGTVGVVLVGVGGVVGVPLPIVGGAIVSGALFGDKMSPLSDTTVLAATTARTGVFDHIRSMAMTTGPAFVLVLILYALLGVRYAELTVPREEVEMIQRALANEFSISWISLLPIVVILFMSFARYPAESSMVAGALVAVVIAVFVQGRTVGAALHSIQYGYESESPVDAVSLLLNRGGIQSMMWSMSLAMIALALGGVLNGVGFLRVLMSGVIRRINSVGTLVSVTIVTCVVANLSMADNYLAIIFGNQIFRDGYKAKGLRMSMMSRSVEEGSTLSAGLIPWTSAGAFFAGSLGVATVDYAPWVLLSFVNVALSTAFAFLGVAILRGSPEKADTTEPAPPAVDRVSGSRGRL